MSFERRILHHGSAPTGTPVVLSLQVVKKCWFELNRQGGCGTGELTLSNDFDDRAQIEIGDWISFEYNPGDRWYLGRVEERRAESPAQVRLRLEGMAIELNEVFPGGFGEHADGQKPHRYAQNNLFTHDPDRLLETFDSVGSATDLVQKLLEQYVVPNTHITFTASAIEAPLQQADTSSLKFRGEESVRSILKELATRAQSASWGVDESGSFFFLRPSESSVAVFREGLDLTSLTEFRDREHLFNRILLTGDYIYDPQNSSNAQARRSYRWRGNFIEPNSRSQHGERRIRIWLPWVRTQADSKSFAKEFFRTYSQPVSRFLVETTGNATVPKPWQGRFAAYDLAGNLLTFSFAETVRVYFDHVPRFRMELGPLDPRDLWAEPPQDERWELPDNSISAGGDVSLPPPISVADPPPPPPLPSNGSGGPGPSSGLSSLVSSGLTSSLVSSGLTSSNLSSLLSSQLQSDSSQPGTSSNLASSAGSSSGAASSGVSSSAPGPSGNSSGVVSSSNPGSSIISSGNSSSLISSSAASSSLPISSSQNSSILSSMSSQLSSNLSSGSMGSSVASSANSSMNSSGSSGISGSSSLSQSSGAGSSQPQSSLSGSGSSGVSSGEASSQAGSSNFSSGVPSSSAGGSAASSSMSGTNSSFVTSSSTPASSSGGNPGQGQGNGKNK